MTNYYIPITLKGRRTCIILTLKLRKKYRSKEVRYLVLLLLYETSPQVPEKTGAQDRKVDSCRSLCSPSSLMSSPFYPTFSYCFRPLLCVSFFLLLLCDFSTPLYNDYIRIPGVHRVQGTEDKRRDLDRHQSSWNKTVMNLHTRTCLRICRKPK